MQRTTRSSTTLLAGLLIALSACASGGTDTAETPAGATDGAVAVQVSNDLVPPSSITVWVVPETGSRRRLGSVPPNGQETFSYSPGIRSMELRLLAEETDGTDHTSNPFDLVSVSGVEWNASSTTVRLNRGGE